MFQKQNVSVSMKRFCIPIILIYAVNLFRAFFFKWMFLKGLIRSFFLETINQISQILYVQNSIETLKNKSKEQKHD